MTPTPELDRAIVVASRAKWDHYENPHVTPNIVVTSGDRTYARALVAELLRDMPIFVGPSGAAVTNAVCAEIKRRAGLEGEG